MCGKKKHQPPNLHLNRYGIFCNLTDSLAARCIHSSKPWVNNTLAFVCFIANNMASAVFSTYMPFLSCTHAYSLCVLIINFV
jgi:hypothetical protein